MAQKIATVSTVFAACDRLNAASERWNREDVRNEVGGGGYVVIDPLIRAWRELKPLREAAPTTPAELLHQVAASLEAHITGFIGETESRQSESQQVFDRTVTALSEQLATLERSLQEKDASLEAMTADRASLVTQFEENQQALSEEKTINDRLITENDGLRGQVVRLESEHKEAIETLTDDAKEQAQAHTGERAKTSKEHAAALANQRKEMVEASEQTENRLMVLLDQERQASKDSTAKLSGQLKEMSKKTQSSREKVIKLEATIRHLRDSNGKLESDLAGEAAKYSDLSANLEEQKARTSSIQREFNAYKGEHKISGDLGALQTAVAALEAKLEQRQGE